MSLDLIPEAKKIVSKSLIANVTELFLELLDVDKYKQIILPETNGATIWQFWIIQPDFADLLIANYPDEIIFFFYGQLIWGRKTNKSVVYLDKVIQDMAHKKLNQTDYITLGEK